MLNASPEVMETVLYAAQVALLDRELAEARRALVQIRRDVAIELASKSLDRSTAVDTLRLIEARALMGAKPDTESARIHSAADSVSSAS